MRMEILIFILENRIASSFIFIKIFYKIKPLYRVKIFMIKITGGSSQLRDQTQISLIAGGFFTTWVTGKP